MEKVKESKWKGTKKKRKRKRREKRQIKKKLERHNPDFPVHQSPRGPGQARHRFYSNLLTVGPWRTLTYCQCGVIRIFCEVWKTPCIIHVFLRWPNHYVSSKLSWTQEPQPNDALLRPVVEFLVFNWGTGRSSWPISTYRIIIRISWIHCHINARPTPANIRQCTKNINFFYPRTRTKMDQPLNWYFWKKILIFDHYWNFDIYSGTCDVESWVSRLDSKVSSQKGWVDS